MAKTRIVYKCEEFRYPSREEYKRINRTYPKIELFDFRHIFIPKLLLEEKRTIEDTYRLENLYWWNNCLLNRLGNLRMTYIYALTSYERGISYEYIKQNHTENLNGYIFDYYAELFYYFFISTRDIVAQIVNLYYNLGKNENDVFFSLKLFEKINDESVKEILIKFQKETKKTSDYRNSFAHRFTPNNPDNRAEMIIEDEIKKIGFGSSKVVSADDIVENIKHSLSSLQSLMKELKIRLK